MWFARIWIPIAVAVTIICILLYAVLQQNYRQSLNDPQIQIAEDVAALISAGAKPTVIVPKQQVDIGRSLSPWFAIYDATGTPIASSGYLNGAMAHPPQGIFTDLASGQAHGAGVKGPVKTQSIVATGENRLTWQPQEGVREAIVVAQAGDKFVVAGRNMREVENRISDMETMIGIAWIVAMFATLIAVWLGSRAQDFITIISA
ncbi:MAG: hypothetical protein JO019_02035 [Candidatus Kaiserbacteria bacterium]|nr:hypothetical protein [Candidatus Kaiserbacteria bacterium]